jgi:antitoxin (DNA-binding transcriptional repressor) of toxin-antitoxin stability system
MREDASMEHYSLKEAQDHLQQLITDARHGKTVLILDENAGAVQLVPVTPPPKSRKAGSARGQIRMSVDFDAPLDDILNVLLP